MKLLNGDCLELLSELTPYKHGERFQYYKQYYEDNKQQQKQYYKDNKEEIKQYNKQYYEDNKDKIKQRRQQRYKLQKQGTEHNTNETNDIIK